MFPSMPASVSPSLVDARADLDSIAEVVVGLMQSTDGLAEGDEDDAFRRLLDRIRDRSAIDFNPYKAATIVRRLRGRMNATGNRSVADYAALVERDPDEYERLIGSLLIKVTEFFRDPKVWDHLRDHVLPGLLDDALREGRELRVWTAGCSSGEEAYSLAITIAEVLDGRPPVDVRIFATDVDAAAIAFARRGVYPAGALKGIPAPLRSRYFTPVGTGFEVVKGVALADGLRRARPERPGAVPADRSAALPERPDLLHAAAPAGRPRDVRLLVAARRPAGPRAVGDRGGVAGPV